MKNQIKKYYFYTKQSLKNFLFIFSHKLKRFREGDFSDPRIDANKLPLNFDFSKLGYNKINFEFGSGNGIWLVDYAKNNPNELIIGVEITSRFLKKSAVKVRVAELENAKVSHFDGVKFLQYLVKNNSLDNIFINFPDPWHKKKHGKRRVFTEKFWQICYKKLKQNGKIYFYSDNEQIYNFALENIDKSNTKFGPEHKPDWYPESKYEKKWEEKGRGFYYFEYQN